MGTGLCIWNLKNNFLLLFCLFIACNSPQDSKVEKPILNIENLKNGTIICRLGNGYFSNYFRQFASKEKKFSHIGIISVENKNVYVYHSEASELTGVGFVKKEKIDVFLKDIKVYDFFELTYNDTIKNGIIHHVKNYHTNKTPFDLNFDSTNDNELYCTELIATSINKALNKKEIEPSLTLNGKKLYALDDIYLNKNVINNK